jgi:hypothetical protein
MGQLSIKVEEMFLTLRKGLRENSKHALLLVVSRDLTLEADSLVGFASILGYDVASFEYHTDNFECKLGSDE